MTTVGTLARRIAACQAVIDGTPEPGERAAARAALDRLTEKLRREGIDDATAVLDPIGASTVVVGPLWTWRWRAAYAASVIAGVAMTSFQTPRWKRVTYYGPQSARMLAEHMALHFIGAIDRSLRGWQAGERARRKTVSRKGVRAFREAAATELELRCKRVANQLTPGWRELVEALLPPDTETVPVRKVLDRRFAGARAGKAAGARIPLSRPLTGSTPTARALEYDRR